MDNLDITQFIQFNAGGISFASYNEIQASLVAKYKEIYGSDIDVSNVTADGIFVNNLALIINNILQTFKSLYANLNVDTATGEYLDNLCRLSNVVRKQPTYSTATLLVSSANNEILLQNTIFVDTNGVEWTYTGEDIVLSSNPTSIVVTCNEIGPIKAEAGTITQTLESSTIVVVQENDANVGNAEETDSELRARRAQSNGAQGLTVLESLVGALLQISGIEDTQIIENNTGETKMSLDGTTIYPHCVYVIIRTINNVTLSSENIATLIYNKLTPGISTVPMTNGHPIVGKWLLNQNLTNTQSDVIFNINFISNLNTYDNIRIMTSGGLTSLEVSYGGEVTVYDGTWENDAYRYIEIMDGDDVTNLDFLSWLSSNAVYQGDTNGEPKSESIALNTNVMTLLQTVYWKLAIPIHPAITVSIIALDNFSSNTINLIGNALISYINNLKLSKNILFNNLIIEATYADPKFNGLPTYYVKDISNVPSLNPNTYYNYTTISTPTVEDNIYTFTIS